MMTTFKKLALTAMAVGGLAAATPSQAVITTFAAFTPVGQIRNLRWEKVGTNGGKLYTTASGTATVPGTVNVKFSFLQPYFVANDLVQSVTAKFTFSATTSGDPATSQNGNYQQNIDSGSFSFLSTSAITVNNTFYAAGSTLLAGTFSPATLAGPVAGTSAGVSSSTGSGDMVVYTSDFLDFSNTITRDFAIALTAVNPVLNRPTNASNSLRTFRASASGNFSSDPSPLINAVPEPAVWGLMIAGFGVVGFQSRRRRSIKTVTA